MQTKPTRAPWACTTTSRDVLRLLCAFPACIHSNCVLTLFLCTSNLSSRQHTRSSQSFRCAVLTFNYHRIIDLTILPNHFQTNMARKKSKSKRPSHAGNRGPHIRSDVKAASINAYATLSEVPGEGKSILLQVIPKKPVSSRTRATIARKKNG